MLALIVSLLAPPAGQPAQVAPAKAAQPALARYRSDIEACLGALPLSDRTEDAGKHAFVWHLKTPHQGRDRVVVLKQPQKGCEGVFTVGRADLRVIAPIDPKRGGMKAFVVQNQPDAECKGDDEGGCERVLIMRDKARRYLSVLPIGQCEWAMSLTAVKLFPGQQSLLLECGFSGGGDMWGHSHQLVHAIDGELTSLLTVGTGYSTAEIGGRPNCRIGPNGGVKVTKRGTHPEIEVVTPDDLNPDEATRKTLRWDGTAFKQIAAFKVKDAAIGSGPTRCDLPRH